jgi:hypothetical protein
MSSIKIDIIDIIEDSREYAKSPRKCALASCWIDFFLAPYTAAIVGGNASYDGTLNLENHVARQPIPSAG